jgi:hypothetical protein
MHVTRFMPKVAWLAYLLASVLIVGCGPSTSPEDIAKSSEASKAAIAKTEQEAAAAAKRAARGGKAPPPTVKLGSKPGPIGK